MATSKNHYRDLLVEELDLPAFRAGFYVTSFLIAALCNFGVFILLIVAHVAIDIVKYREVHGYDWKNVLRGTVRENVSDAAVLLTGLLVSLLLHPGIYGHADPFVAQQQTIVRAIVILGTKILVLRHFWRATLHPTFHLNAVHFASRKTWHLSELLAIACVPALVLALTFLPTLFRIDPDTAADTMARQLVPWVL